VKQVSVFGKPPDPEPAEINQATATIHDQGYTFKNAHLADAIVARMMTVPTMTVILLLDADREMASLTRGRIAGTTRRGIAPSCLAASQRENPTDS
jgi:hypothetical protein